MESYHTLNDVLVNLFNDIMDIEEKAIITGEFKNISIKDMHVIEAIGICGARNMSSVAKTLSVTVGTLTIAINNLLKKGYVERARSECDRRVVLISLTSKGEKAQKHHAAFHEKMVQSILQNLSEEQRRVLITALENLSGFFSKYKS